MRQVALQTAQALTRSDTAATSPADQAYRLSDEFEQLKNATIMMVDDEPITMEAVRMFLEDAGYRKFVLVEDSEQAIARLEEHRPDVLLLDVMMPKVSGFDILLELRRNHEFAHLPVIILTSSSDADTKLQALDLGATDFLSKPVDPSELSLRVRNTLAVKEYQDQLAFYDSVTGLPNKKLFNDQVTWALRSAQRREDSIALLHIELDNFKRIVDTFGPKTGDQVIWQLAERLQGCVRQSDSVARNVVQADLNGQVFRLGSEDFSVLCPTLRHTENAAVVASRILESMRQPFAAEGTEVTISPSIGIVGYPTDGDNSADLIRRGVSAAGHAHSKGGNRYEFYSSEMNARSVQRLHLEAELRRAIENQQLVLHYQPKINVLSGQVTSVEALIRWQREDGKLISPAQFIPVAEETGLIAQIGSWVIEEACRQAASWRRAGIDIGISVNVSAKQFFQTDLRRLVRMALTVSGLEPGTLTLEMTESLLMDDIAGAIIVLTQLRQLGVKVSIDDFGTGYSSLAYLKRLPADELKIDRSFIVDLAKSHEDMALVKATVFIAHEFGLKVVAEGVEHHSQIDKLMVVDCDEYQGFYYSRPVPPEKIEQMLHSAAQGD